MNTKPENKIILEEEKKFYDYWKVLVKRKRILIGIFLVPLVVVTLICLSIPRYYRGENEISNPVLPPSSIVGIIGDIDETRIAKIFTKTPDAIKSVSISFPKKTNDKLNIIIDAKTADVIPQASQDLYSYICNLPEIQEKIARMKVEANLKLEKLMEAKKINLVFLNQITDLMKRNKLSSISFNPADLIKKDADLSLEILNVQGAGIKPGVAGPLKITTQPSNAQLRQKIIITGILSLFIGIFIVFFLEYIERIETRD